MINSDYLNNLNKAQKEAVLYLDGPLLIVAGAGSGKTKVLTSRIAHIIKEKKAFPNQILSVTFTNKAAKEMQKLLMKRKSELEADLTRARGTDFSAVQTDVVNPGTLVKVTDLTNQKEETYTILGAWDSEPEDGIISYLSPLANILIGKKPGDEVDLEQDQLVKKYRLNSIASHEYEFKHHGLHDESGQSVPVETVSE